MEQVFTGMVSQYILYLLTVWLLSLLLEKLEKFKILGYLPKANFRK